MVPTPFAAGGDNHSSKTKTSSFHFESVSLQAKKISLLIIFVIAWTLLSYSGFNNSSVQVADGDASEFTNYFTQRWLQEVGSTRKDQKFNNVDTSLSVIDTDDFNRAIFLLLFGLEAAESTIAERCILSIRRRGAFNGPIVLLTDAPLERYEGIFDDNVFVLNNKEEDMKRESFEVGKMKYKRFKTLVLNYIDLVPELDGIDFVYYMDIDIMMGAPFSELIFGLEEKYQVHANMIKKSNHDENGDKPTPMLFFFKDASAKHFANSGFIIINKHHSKHCLDLWRDEMDTHPKRRMDQESLNALAERINEGTETKCQIMSVEYSPFLNYPRCEADLTNLMEREHYPNLIHIFNSHKADELDAACTEAFVADVLNLSEEERNEHKYGKVSFHPSYKDWTLSTPMKK